MIDLEFLQCFFFTWKLFANHLMDVMSVYLFGKGSLYTRILSTNTMPTKEVCILESCLQTQCPEGSETDCSLL